MPADEATEPTEFRLTRDVVGLVRWRGARAFMWSLSADPRLDLEVAKILRLVDDVTGEYLASEFRLGYATAVSTAKGVAMERQSWRAMKIPPRGTCAPAPESQAVRASDDHPEHPRIRAFMWSGYLAYVKGIDRSPWHDVPVASILRSSPNELGLLLGHAWEAGWDEAHDCGEHLRRDEELRRKAQLSFEGLRIISTRRIGTAPRTTDEE